MAKSKATNILTEDSRAPQREKSWKSPKGASLCALSWATKPPIPMERSITRLPGRPGSLSETSLFPSGKDGAERTSATEGGKERRTSTVFIGETLSRVGDPFSPEQQNIENLGVFQRELPKNVYAAVILVYLNGETASEGFVRVIRSVSVPLVLCTVAQVTLAAYLRAGVLEVQGDLAPDCTETTWWLRCVALFAFVGLCVQHMIMTLQMHQWLELFPRSSSHAQLQLQKFISKDASTRHVVHRPVTGITVCERVAFYTFVLCPLLLSTCFTLWAGSGAVLRSGSDFDLVLNNVAAIFVLDLDDYAYLLLLPQTIRNATEGLPPLNRGVEEGGMCWAMMRSFGINFYSWIVLAVILAIEWPTFYAWCGSLE
jgi:hypothetical protein